MVVKFHKITVKEGASNGIKYVQRRHGYGCQHCRNACKGYIGQVDTLALPYSVHKQEV